MDRIQNSVGLDVFSFTSSSTETQTEGANDASQPDSDGPPTVAVQVGKYLTRGVLLTVTQGTTAESQRYNVDVDLKYGLMLQLETGGQNTDQRDLKVSLIWSKTY
jgi:autotransporter translocation and assembly factor TamB